MLSTALKRKFATESYSGVINALKKNILAPVKHAKRILEPTAQDYNTMSNVTEEAFDEVSHEWQTLLTHNAFDINVFNYLENVQTSNFGTVDNPLVVFTSDLPFRYVGCAGPTNEDDYEGHELMFFMLREGSMQRCPSCGQVFKLVRLRNEYSPEMDYYYANFHTYEMQEMGESDTTHLMNPFKMNTHYEYTNHESPSNMVYSMINPDEHDRMLIDPAYRLEKTKAIEEKMKVYVMSLKEAEKEFISTNGIINKIPMNKVDYTTLIDCEKAIMHLDRTFRQVTKFNNRQYADPENHERRELRMQNRQDERWDNNYTFWLGHHSEAKQQFNDYFQTELEEFPENEQIESLYDEQTLLKSEEYRLDAYDFQEMHTRGAEDDQSSMIEKKVFQFKYRLASDPLDVYSVRQERMIKRQAERFEDGEFNKILEAIYQQQDDKISILQTKRKYFDFIYKETINQYKDYYEDDTTQDFSVLEDLGKTEKLAFASAFENHQSERGASDTTEGTGITGYSFKAIQWDNAAGFWVNFSKFVADLSEIKPEAEQLGNQNMFDINRAFTAAERREAENDTSVFGQEDRDALLGSKDK